MSDFDFSESVKKQIDDSEMLNGIPTFLAEPIPIYGGKAEPIKVYVNGKEVPFEGNLSPTMHGVFDNDTGIVTYIGKLNSN